MGMNAPTPARLAQIDEVALTMRRSKWTVRRWVRANLVQHERRATVIYIHVDGSGIAINPPQGARAKRRTRRYTR
jgi:hypothetical protein